MKSHTGKAAKKKKSHMIATQYTVAGRVESIAEDDAEEEAKSVSDMRRSMKS